MKTYDVQCIYDKINRDKYTRDNPLRVSVPGSKSITNRALLLATLADGVSILKGVLFSDDSRHFLKCIQDLGFNTVVDEENKTIRVEGHGGLVPLAVASQYVGSAGTAARFLTAYLGVSNGEYNMDASEQMKKRPMNPLLDSLKELGCEITFLEKDGFFPFILKSHGFSKNEISIDIKNSSQFLSALLISSFLSKEDFTIHVKGTHGMAYIDMTCKMMSQFGVDVVKADSSTFVIKKGQHYNALCYQIEPDVSASCYFYSMALLLNIPVLVENVHFDSLQGDVEFMKILTQMGCNAEDTSEGIIVLPPESGLFEGINVDMSSCSDQAITLAAIAPFAKTPTTITGIGHIRLQESDRLSAIANELTKMGVKCDEMQDSITIYPSKPSKSIVNTYEDHRMAMGFSLIGLRADNITIDNPLCCKKTFENYFEVLDKLILEAIQ